jgi:hypothetical protein
MTLRPARRDPARIRAALGIQTPPPASIDDALAALAKLKRKQDSLREHGALATPKSAQPRTDADHESARERALRALTNLAAGGAS